MFKKNGFIFACLLLLTIVFQATPLYASNLDETSLNNESTLMEISEEKGSEISSGTWGDAPWIFYENGELIIQEGELYSSMPWSADIPKKDILKITFEGKVILPSSSLMMFKDLINLTAIENGGNIDTSKVTNMTQMFNNTPALKSLDTSTWNTSNVTNMQSVFSSTGLESLDVSNWDTSNVTNMTFMFSSSSSLKDLDVSKWNVSNVTSLNSTFSGVAITALDVSNWDTSNVTNMSMTFGSCGSLIDLDLSKWNTSNVTNMRAMFQSCYALENLNIASFDTSNVTDMGNMFSYTFKLKSLDIANWNTSKVTSLGFLFQRTGIETVDVSKWDTSNVTNMASTFKANAGLKSIDLSNWDTSSVTNMTSFFEDCTSLNEITLGSNFKFIGDTKLPAAISPNPDNWTGDNTGNRYDTTADFTANYDGSVPDTYRRITSYTVTFEPNGGKFEDNTTESKQIEVKPTYIVNSQKVTKEGYTFVGWFTNEELTEKYDFSTRVNSDFDLYAKWEKEISKDITLIGGKGTLSTKVEEQLKDFNLNRISGTDRYETAVEVSKQYASSDIVVLASGITYTDELTATVLANKLNAPILLTRTNGIPSSVEDELVRLKAKKIILIGGTGTITKNVENNLIKKYGKNNISRLGGPSRYETAALVGEEIIKITGATTDAILVDGTNYPDAIAMTSMAVKNNTPILLTPPEKLNSTTEKTLKDWNISKVTIGGGHGSVSTAIENNLKSNIATVDRIAGINRYETSVLAAKAVYPTSTHIVIASGEVYPDAIIGAPYATKNGYPIVLAKSNEVPSVVMDYITSK